LVSAGPEFRLFEQPACKAGETYLHDLLRDQQVISMSDGLIRNVSGVVRSEHWGDLYANISARGSQVQAFRNGFNVVNSYWGPLTEDMSFVENVEFVKGPAGFMLSSGDPSGLYNVVTKKPTGITKGEASITLGSYALFRTTLDLDGKLGSSGKLLYRLNLSAQNKESHRANEYNDRYVIAPVISYQLDEKTKLTLEYNYQRANMSNVGSFYIFSPESFKEFAVDFTTLPAGTPGTEIDDHSVYLNVQHDFNKDWKITAQVAKYIYNQIGTSMWPFWNPGFQHHQRLDLPLRRLSMSSPNPSSKQEPGSGTGAGWGSPKSANISPEFSAVSNNWKSR
jgi:iron complex outermembrane receptor protein